MKKLVCMLITMNALALYHPRGVPSRTVAEQLATKHIDPQGRADRSLFAQRRMHRRPYRSHWRGGYPTARPLRRGRDATNIANPEHLGID